MKDDEKLFVHGAVIDTTRELVDTVPGISLDPPYSQGRLGLYLVQLIGPVKDDWLATLQRLGSTIAARVRENGLILAMRPGDASQLKRERFVQYLTQFHSSLKRRESCRGSNTEEFMVIDAADAPAVYESLLAWTKHMRSEVRIERINDGQVRFRAAIQCTAISQIIADALVISVSLEPSVEFSDERAALALTSYIDGQGRELVSGAAGQYKNWLGSACAFCGNLRNENFWIGFADTGFYNGKSGPFPAEVPSGRIRFGTNVSDHADTELIDKSFHGTFTAAVAVGDAHAVRAPDGYGYLRSAGIAPSAGLFVTKVDASLNPMDFGPTSISEAAAAAPPVRIQNHSYNQYSLVPANCSPCQTFFDGTYSSLSQVFDTMVISTGMTLTVSAGNQNQQPECGASCLEPTSTLRCHRPRPKT
jgi:hypothetical protein